MGVMPPISLGRGMDDPCRSLGVGWVVGGALVLSRLSLGEVVSLSLRIVSFSLTYSHLLSLSISQSGGGGG